MPPIPIHKDSPIKPTEASKPDGATPHTTNPPPTRTTPASNLATTTTDPSDPPPPQPGARPIPPTAFAHPPSSSDPPAPQPGYTATHTTTETRLGGPPHQFTIPPPSGNQLAGRSTTTDTTASKPGPTTLNLGPIQSPHQAEHSQGAAPTRASGEERRSLEHPPGYTQAPDNTTYSAGLGGQQSSGDGSIGGAAWNVLSKAGEALKKGEEAAWRAVRDK